MAEPKTVLVEIWPLAADHTGVWLISGGNAWQPELAVTADTDIQDEAMLAVTIHGVARDDVKLLHSSSWRDTGRAMVATFVAIVDAKGQHVRARWPQAKPITAEMMAAVAAGRWQHDPDMPPVPRVIDVLLHGLRHLEFLRRTDSNVRKAFDANWRHALSGLEPALAGLYEFDQVGDDEGRSAAEAA
jgi:hypothetical protein